MKKISISIIILMAISLIATCVSLCFLGDVIPTHIGPNGQPDLFGSKYFLLLFPAISIVVGVSMLLVAKYAKVSDNYRKYLLITGIILQVLFLAITTVFIICALLYKEDTEPIDFSKVMMVIVGALFIVLSNFMPKIEKNRTLGFKIYWSMYNEVTWQKTHRFTGITGTISGIILLVCGLIFKEYINFIIFTSILVVFMIANVVASYIFYKEEKNKEKLENTSNE